MTMCLTLFFLFRHGFKKATFCRNDPSPALPYYQPEDFDLSYQNFSFQSGKWLLSGSFYFYQNVEKKGVILFLHGAGAGRSAYIKEIASFARRGYVVYAYDNTGCGESEGRYFYGLGHTNRDIKAFFAWFEMNNEFKTLPLYVVGHSWGGYGALLTSSYPSVRKIISLAGFTSPSREFAYYVNHGRYKKIRFLMSLVLKSLGGYDADVAVYSSLKKSSAKILYVQGDKDPMVLPQAGYLDLKHHLPNASIKYLIVPGRGHQPWRSEDANNYQAELMKKGLITPYAPIELKMDIVRATALDENVMKSLFDFLDN